MNARCIKLAMRVRHSRGVCALAVMGLLLGTAQSFAQSTEAIDQQLDEKSWLADKMKKPAVPEPETKLTEDDSIEARLAALEEQAFETEKKIGDRTLVTAFDAVKLDFGGFLTQAFSTIHGKQNTEFSPNFTQLELLIRAEMNDKWSLFTALGFLREADVDVSDPENPTFRGSANRVPNIISWMNYRHSDALQLRAGRFVTPHGIINIEHFPPSLLETNQPQFLRPFSGATIFSNFLNGLQGHGRVFVGQNGSDIIEYSAYAGFHNPSPDKVIAGGRVAYGHRASGVTAGINYSHGSREAGGGATGHFSSVPSRSLVGNSYETVGADILIDKGRLLWKTEAFYSFEMGESDRWTVYTQPSVRLTDKWLAFYRYDYFAPGQDLKHTTEHVVGFNYLPISIVRLRGAVFLRDFDNGGDDVVLGQLSATVSF